MRETYILDPFWVKVLRHLWTESYDKSKFAVNPSISFFLLLFHGEPEMADIMS